MCPICKNTNLSSLRVAKDYYLCPNCQLVWLKKFPKATYRKDYYQGKSTLFSALFAPIAFLFHKIRESYLNKNNVNLWIDMGAGAGEFLKIVSAKEKIGVEISSAGRQLMEENNLKTLTPLQFLGSKNLSAEVISFWHVLEHVEKPWEYLRAAKKNLREGGAIVIGVPNIDSLEFKFFGKDWFHLAPEYHLWHFSPKSINLMLENEGFKVSSINFWSPEHTIAGLLQSFINKTSGTDAVLHKLIKRSGSSKLPVRGLVWSLFWLTAGLPVILLFWIIEVLLKRSGTIVITAK